MADDKVQALACHLDNLATLIQSLRRQRAEMLLADPDNQSEARSIGAEIAALEQLVQGYQDTAELLAERSGATGGPLP